MSKNLLDLQKSNLHTGHRKRLKDKYMKNGLDSFEFHEILELLLFCPLRRKNTNEIGHEMAKKFNNSLAEIFEASDERLKEIENIGDETVLHIRFLADITRLYNLERAKAAEKTSGNKKEHEEFLTAYYTGKRSEEVVLICLNNRMERISCDLIYSGSVNSSKVDMNKITKIALGNNASGIIVAHNHPGGTAYPSKEDVEITRKLEWFFNDISIKLIEHYVVADTNISGIREISRRDFKNL